MSEYEVKTCGGRKVGKRVSKIRELVIGKGSRK
jgi:hypothetical protein